LLAQATNNLREVAPLLADLLSITTGDRYQQLELMPQKRKEKTLAELLAQVEGLSTRECPGRRFGLGVVLEALGSADLQDE
jgi:hypothetical protein